MLSPQQKFVPVNCVLRAQKIAREKNNCHDLAVVAKKSARTILYLIGGPGRPEFSLCGVRNAAPNDFAISQMVLVLEKFEPTFVNASAGRRISRNSCLTNSPVDRI